MGGSASVPFNPDRDIPSLDGKVILITGGNSGLGKQSILELVKHNPKEIWLGARSKQRADEAIEDIKRQVPGAGSKIKFLEMDMASLSSVSAAAHKFCEQSPQLDILIENAGIMAVPEGLTKDGYEIQFGTNYVGHALLTKLLMPTMLKTAEKPGSDVRLVVLSSAGHQYTDSEKGIRFEVLKTTAPNMGTSIRYGQSKLANILHAQEVAQHYPQITAVSLHPGVVNTNLPNTMTQTNFLLRIGWAIFAFFAGVDVKTGTLHQLWASTAKGVKSGEYYYPIGKLGTGTKFAKDRGLAKKLWDWTEKELESYS